MARIEKFLAAGSRIVVKRDGKFQWYQTKKDVPLPATCTDVPDPMNSGSVETVKYAVCEKIGVWFPERIVRSRVVIEDGDVDPQALKTQYGVFHYDVHGERFPNPSNLLYPIAVRMSESCWIMRAGDVPYSLIARMIDAGCTVEFDKFDVSESKKHVTRAVERLVEYGQERIASAEASRADAQVQLEGAAEEGLSEKQARTRFDGRIKAIEKQLKDAEANINGAMSTFGIKCASFVNATRLATVSKETRSLMIQQALAYDHAARLLAASESADARAMAALAANSQVPVGVLADMLMEQGHETAGVALNAAFSNSNEFSLSDD